MRILTATALGLILLLGLAACGDDEERVLTILYWQAPSIPNPYLSGGTKDTDAGAVTLQPLAYQGPDSSLVPALAEEIPTIGNGGVAADRRSITWTLKKDLKWSDGSDLTADDVVFTWRYCSTEETGCTNEGAFAGIESVEAPDDRTVVITFAEPTPYPYDPFVGGDTPIISAKQFAGCVGEAAAGCDEQNYAPLGPGPYRLVSFTIDTEAVYERNPHYHGEKPYFDRVVILAAEDAVAAARAVLAEGTADYAWNMQVEPEVLAELEAEGTGVVVSAFANLVERIVLNQTNADPSLGDDRRSEYLDGQNPHPFLTLHAVRQAMSLALDRERLATLYGSRGKPECNIIVGPAHYVSEANSACLTQDIAGANALLDANGVIDSDGDGIREHNGVPLRITFQTSANSIRQATQELARDWWRQIGIETELIQHDASLFFGGDPIEDREASYRRFLADVQMYATGGGLEPQGHLGEQRCDHIPTRENNWADGNDARACLPEFDAAYEALPPLPLGPEREALTRRLNDLLVQNYAVIPIVNRGFVSAHATSLKGVNFNGWDTDMWNIGEWRR